MQTQAIVKAITDAMVEHLVPVLVAAVSGYVLKFLSGHKKDVQYAQIAIGIIKNILYKELGPKADAIMDVWERATKQVEGGKYTQEEMVNTFVEIVKTSCPHPLTTLDLMVVKECAEITFHMMDTKKAPTALAVKMMMTQQR